MGVWGDSNTFIAKNRVYGWGIEKGLPEGLFAPIFRCCYCENVLYIDNPADLTNF